MWLLTICMMVMAQSKQTPQAMLRIGKEKMKMEQRMKKHQAPSSTPIANDLRLIVKVNKTDAAETYRQMRMAGATIQAILGQQAVISLPMDSVAALERIEGVRRVDTGKKPCFKSDITREVVKVNQLNGPNALQKEFSFTGKGVTVCVLDVGFDFQHPAFKDSLGQSRIKAVYMQGMDGGSPFTVEDPDAGTITFPGSVYDTPELIASLTTDYAYESHGTHTAGIAAGTLSPQGFGGMAPEADLVLIPMGDYVNEDDPDIMYAVLETSLMFAANYAKQSGQPTVLNFSANSHDGPHDGTGTVSEIIEEISSSLIPVISVGNEGGSPIHIYYQFNETDTIVKTFLPNEASLGWKNIESSFCGYTRKGGDVSVQVKFYNSYTKKIDWQSDILVVSEGANNIERTYNESPVNYKNSVTIDDIAFFSSYSTMLNGITQPVICAPGFFVVSSWNHYNILKSEHVLDNMQWQGIPYSSESGTSMSCPVVSGVVALWLQANPNLTIDEIKEVMKETAFNDSYTLASPDRFGYGKIDAAKGIEYITGLSGIQDMTEYQKNNHEVYDLQGRRVSRDSLGKGIYVKGNKKILIR